MNLSNTNSHIIFNNKWRKVLNLIRELSNWALIALMFLMAVITANQWR